MESSRRHGQAERRAVRRLSCPETRTDLDCESSLAIIEPYFIATQERFSEHELKRFADVRMTKVRLECSALFHDSPRHFAAAAENGRLIVVAPHLAELPEETVLAILAHEFGHAMDFARPGHYALDHGLLFEQPEIPAREGDKRADQARIARIRQWSARDQDAIEITADKVAEHVTGRTIGYVGPCELQAFDRGSPRRVGLR